MNELIGSVFGDPSIFLDCDSSECLYYTEVPGYKVYLAPTIVSNRSVLKNQIVQA